MAGDTTLNGMLSTPATGYVHAIYHDDAPSDAHYPFVVFSKSSGVPTEAFHDPSAFENDVWLIKAVDRSPTADQAEQIADRLKTLLNDQPPTISGAPLLYLRRKSDVKYPERAEGVLSRHCGALWRLVTTD